MSKYTFIDLFAGIGGFRMGFEKEGLQCVFSSENNPKCQTVYQENFGEKPFSHIEEIDAALIPDFDVLLAGFPCQPFSISGHKKGFQDTRGTLFFEICRIIKKKMPAVLVLENVKFIIHHDGGRTLEVIISALSELGYSVDYKLLNAKDFGLPQNRERLVIVGTRFSPFNFNLLIKKKTLPLEAFLEKSGNFEYLDKSEYTILDTVTEQRSGLLFVGYRNKNIWKKGIRPNTKHLSRVHRQPNRIYSVKGVHPTIPSQESAGRFFIYIPEEDRVRKLTINECYRIMGFPNNFVKSRIRGEVYKQIGNSVPVPMVRAIARAIIEQGAINEREREANRPVQQITEHGQRRLAI